MIFSRHCSFVGAAQNNSTIQLLRRESADFVGHRRREISALPLFTVHLEASLKWSKGKGLGLGKWVAKN